MHHRGAHAPTDSRSKLYHQQKPSASKASATTSKGNPVRQTESSRRSTHGSATSVAESDFSGIRASQNILDKSLSGSSNIQTSGNYGSTGRQKRQIQPFQPPEQQQHSWKKSENATNQLAASRNNSRSLQSFQSQPNNRLQTAQPLASRSTERLVQPNSGKPYAPPTRTYKYSDRSYPLQKPPISPTLPEEDEKTTTSGSYTVNHEELKPELEALVIRDTVV